VQDDRFGCRRRPIEVQEILQRKKSLDWCNSATCPGDFAVVQLPFTTLDTSKYYRHAFVHQRGRVADESVEEWWKPRVSPCATCHDVGQFQITSCFKSGL